MFIPRSCLIVVLFSLVFDGAVNQANGQAKATLKGHFAAIKYLRFSPDGEYIVSVAGPSVMVWDAAKYTLVHTAAGNGLDAFNNTPPRRFPAIAKAVTARCYSADCQRAATGEKSGVIKVWDVKNRNLLWSVKGKSKRVIGLVFSKDRKFLAGCYRLGCTKVWDAKTGKELSSSSQNERFEEQQIFNTPVPFVFTPDGRFLTLSGRAFYDWRTWELVAVLDGLGRVTAIAFSPDGRVMAIGSADKMIRIWDTPNGKNYK